MDIIATYTGQLLEVHDPNVCAGHHCCIHNPSRHALDRAPLHWYPGTALMLRICEHRIGHPDPDSVAALFAAGRPASDTHVCDGCCGPVEERMGAT